MPLRTSLSAEIESPEAGPVLRLRAGVLGAGPSGPGMARQKPGAHCAALATVRRAIRKPMTPDGVPAKPGGVFSICPPHLFTSRRRTGASASVTPRRPLTPGAVKGPLGRRRITSLSFRALQPEGGISDPDVKPPGTAGHYKDPLYLCSVPRFTSPPSVSASLAQSRACLDSRPRRIAPARTVPVYQGQGYQRGTLAGLGAYPLWDEGVAGGPAAPESSGRERHSDR